jgi:hypothetical protein
MQDQLAGLKDRLPDLGSTGMLIAVLVGIIAVIVVFRSIVMWFAAKAAGVEGVTFLRAVGAALLASLLSSVGSALGSQIHVCGAPIILSLLGSVLGIKFAFDTTWGKGFLVWLLDLIALVIVIVLMFGLLVLLGGLAGAPPQ